LGMEPTPPPATYQNAVAELERHGIENKHYLATLA
jgi:hypothetical protein